MKKRTDKKPLTLKTRLILSLVCMAAPLTGMVLGILFMIHNYSDSYNRIMKNIKVANEYNITFKADIEYSMYRVMIGLISAEEFGENESIMEGNTAYATVVKNPIRLIEKARMDFSARMLDSPGADSIHKLRGIQSCLNSLETAVNKVFANFGVPGTYDENNTIWENDIQGLCSMIQEYINEYIYYETLKMEELQRQMETRTALILNGFLLFLAVLLGTDMFLAAKITRSVTTPIAELKATAERLGQGDLTAKAQMSSLEEINVLARTFNKMSDEIKGLMEKTKQEQRNLREIELKLHQEQINPHFLYNTLDSIVWMAEGGNNEQVVEMTTDLSDFFRTVLSEGQDFITIAEEESHIRSYLKIQKIRYEDVLDYQITIEPAIRDRVVLKMILQPIVENALYHGIKNKRGGGTIFVRGYEDPNGITFEVEDNGIGMDEETLEKLRRKVKGNGTELQAGRGFGMNNVAQRLRMYYGEEAEIVIDSRKNAGTRIRISLGPVSRRKGLAGKC